MPLVYKLSPEEVRTELDKGKSQRQLITEQYDTMLDGFNADDWGEVKLDNEEKRATVRNRLKAAAQRRGLSIRFKRGQGDRMRFEVLPFGAAGSDDDDIDNDSDVAQTAGSKPRKPRKSETSDAPARKRGRPRTTAS